MNLKFCFGVVGGRGGGQHGMEVGVTLVGGRTPGMVEVMQLGGWGPLRRTSQSHN